MDGMAATAATSTKVGHTNSSHGPLRWVPSAQTRLHDQLHLAAKKTTILMMTDEMHTGNGEALMQMGNTHQALLSGCVCL